MACGSEREIHVDHIEPRSKNIKRSLDITNLQILCSECNLKKSNKNSNDYRTEYDLELLDKLQINPEYRWVYRMGKNYADRWVEYCKFKSRKKRLNSKRMAKKKKLENYRAAKKKKYKYKNAKGQKVRRYESLGHNGVLSYKREKKVILVKAGQKR